MLDAFIIEELKRREERRRQDQERPALRLPIEEERPTRKAPRPGHLDHGPEPADDNDRERDDEREREREREKEQKRGVIIIDI